MQSFILLLVHALWPNDILEHGHADTVAPREITAIINPEKDNRLITQSHKRHTVTKHKIRALAVLIYKGQKYDAVIKIHLKAAICYFLHIKKNL